MTIEKEFPELLEAYSYAQQGSYTNALDIYNEILPQVNQDSSSYSCILLEYALCLLESATFQIEENYRKLLGQNNDFSNKKANHIKKDLNDVDVVSDSQEHTEQNSPKEDLNDETDNCKEKGFAIQNNNENNDIEEDLEICWASLETCKVHFEIINDHEKLSRVHKGLADLLSLNNHFDQAIVEYKNCLNYSQDDEATVELFECIADCYRNLEEFDEAKDFYKQIGSIHKKIGNMEEYEEMVDLIEGLDLIKEQNKLNKENMKIKDEMKANIQSDDIINIDHLKKSKIINSSSILSSENVKKSKTIKSDSELSSIDQKKSENK